MIPKAKIAAIVLIIINYPGCFLSIYKFSVRNSENYFKNGFVGFVKESWMQAHFKKIK